MSAGSARPPTPTPSTSQRPFAWRSTPAPSARIAAAVHSTSSPSSRPVISVRPTARAPSISERCEIDLSPGTRIVPVSGALARTPASGAAEREIKSSGIDTVPRDHTPLPMRFGWPICRSRTARTTACLLLTGCAGCGNAAPAFASVTPVRRPRFNREYPLAKPEWGTKRICPSCGTRYYDLLREQVICPKCSTPYDPEAFLRARRSRAALPVEKELVTADADADVEAEDIETVEDEEEAVPLADGEEEEDEEMIED